MLQKDYILENVKEQFEIHKYDKLHSFRVFIFVCIDDGLILYNDTKVDYNLFCELLQNDIIKFDTICAHQGEKSLRYRFKNYKYPRYLYRNIPYKLRKQVYERDGYACVICGSDRRLSVDHILAWHWGGLTEIDNLQTLCTPCNSSKSNR